MGKNDIALHPGLDAVWHQSVVKGFIHIVWRHVNGIHILHTTVVDSDHGSIHGFLRRFEEHEGDVLFLYTFGLRRAQIKSEPFPAQDIYQRLVFIRIQLFHLFLQQTKCLLPGTDMMSPAQLSLINQLDDIFLFHQRIAFAMQLYNSFYFDWTCI